MKILYYFLFCFILFTVISCKKKATLFEQVPSSYSGYHKQTGADAL
jgi:hypothetical protein